MFSEPVLETKPWPTSGTQFLAPTRNCIVTKFLAFCICDWTDFSSVFVGQFRSRFFLHGLRKKQAMTDRNVRVIKPVFSTIYCTLEAYCDFSCNECGKLASSRNFQIWERTYPDPFHCSLVYELFFKKNSKKLPEKLMHELSCSSANFSSVQNGYKLAFTPLVINSSCGVFRDNRRKQQCDVSFFSLAVEH